MYDDTRWDEDTRFAAFAVRTILKRSLSTLHILLV